MDISLFIVVLNVDIRKKLNVNWRGRIAGLVHRSRKPAGVTAS